MEKFDGFSAATFKFLRELKVNNNRDWFLENKPRYRQDVVEPALAFVTDFGRRLNGVHSDIIYDTRTNGAGSLFRIYRDTRFSKDKTPYKTHLGVFFWLGIVPVKMANPGIYVHLDSEGAQLHSGLYRFEPERMKIYRDVLSGEKTAADLHKILAGLKKKGFVVQGEQYKRVPPGFDKTSDYADLARYKGLYVSAPSFKKNLVTTPKLLNECMKYARQVAKFNNWFANNLF